MNLPSICGVGGGGRDAAYPLCLGAAIILLLAALIAPARASRPSFVPNGCYAFRRQGRIWLSCQGNAQPISNHHYWAQFAISPRGNYLAARGGRWALHDHPTTAGRPALLLRVAGNQTKWMPAAGADLLPTCGTVEISGRVVWKGRVPLYVGWPRDLATGSPLRFPGARYSVACSSDLKTVVAEFVAARPEVTDSASPAGTSALYLLGRTPAVPLATGVVDAAVSPDGRVIAYDATGPDTMALCTEVLGSSTSCVPLGELYSGSLGTVSDTGEVLLSQHTDESCRFEGLTGVVKEGQKPGKFEYGGPCPGAFYWRAGMAKPILLQDLADAPQWITPDAAKALLAGYKANRWPKF